MEIEKQIFEGLQHNDIKIYYEDIAVISCPRPLGEMFKNCPKGLKDHVPEKFQFHELAILNKDHTKFILVQEFNKKIVRTFEDYVKKNEIKPWTFSPDVPFLINDDTDFIYQRGKAITLYITKEELKYGISLRYLQEINERHLLQSAKNLFETHNAKMQALAEQKRVDDIREQYCNF